MTPNDARTVDVPGLEKVLIAYARYFPLRKGKLRLIDGLWRAVSAGCGSVRLADLRYGGFKMPCDLNETLQRQFYFFGTYFVEERLLDSWTRAAKEAAVIFDVGANAGIYSLAALASQPAALVHAFEPTPEIARRLRETAQLNGLDGLFVHDAAVSSRPGHAALRRFRGETGSNEGMNFISADRSERAVERVKTIRLDEFCRNENIDQVDLMKVDVQGHEYAVLQGAEGLVSGGKLKNVFLELNWAGGSGGACAATRCISLLARAGYRFADPADSSRWRDAGPWLRCLSDVIASRRGEE
jgi:FkbM family methyltransferase